MGLGSRPGLMIGIELGSRQELESRLALELGLVVRLGLGFELGLEVGAEAGV